MKDLGEANHELAHFYSQRKFEDLDIKEHTLNAIKNILGHEYLTKI